MFFFPLNDAVRNRIPPQKKFHHDALKLPQFIHTVTETYGDIWLNAVSSKYGPQNLVPVF